jgi:hypothetical protein
VHVFPVGENKGLNVWNIAIAIALFSGGMEVVKRKLIACAIP